MPQPASALERERYLKALILGPPKVGKSTTVVATAPGPAYVINCDDKSALAGAARMRKDFEFDLCKGWNDMAGCMKTAREGVKAGQYKTIIIDTFSSFAARLEDECLAQTDSGKGPDGRRAYPEYERRLRHVVEHFLRQPCHFIAISHYLETGGIVGEEQLAKTGEGLMPLLAGKARATIPALFNDVIFMDLRKGERLFVTSPTGAWGPGCRSLRGDEPPLPADVTKLIKLIEEINNPKKAPAATRQPTASRPNPTPQARPQQPVRR